MHIATFINKKNLAIPQWWMQIQPRVAQIAKSLNNEKKTLVLAARTCDDIHGELAAHQVELEFPLPEDAPGITLFLRECSWMLANIQEYENPNIVMYTNKRV